MALHQEEKKNPVITLKAQAYNFNFETLKTEVVSKEGWNEINRGFTVFKDLSRMRFVINETNIDEVLTPSLVAGAEQREFNKAWDDYREDKKISDHENLTRKRDLKNSIIEVMNILIYCPKIKTGIIACLQKKFSRRCSNMLKLKFQVILSWRS